MAQFAEFLTNLLFLRSKFLTKRAVEVFHRAVQKCLTYKKKISVDYNKTIHMVEPFENMFDFINYSAYQYTCEGENYIVTCEQRLYEELYKIAHRHAMKKKEENRKGKHVTNYIGLATETNSEKNHHKKNKKTERNQKLNTSKKVMRHEDNKQKQKYQDYIVDNLHAILKSQELLFKNIIKLVHILEKDSSFDTDTRKFKKIKNKLAACRDVLSDAVVLQNVSNLINNIIEEEITRCRFRHGESKTSEQISLKKPRPEGIAAALETSTHGKNATDKAKLKPAETHIQTAITLDRQNEVLSQNKLNAEVKAHSENLLKNTENPKSAMNPPKTEKQLESDKQVNTDQTAKTETEDAKLIDVNEKHFYQFEDDLWHSLTTLKYVSLKDDYVNRTKCAFHNKRQFLALEALLTKHERISEENENFEKFLSVSESMFQVTERKLMFNKLKEKMKAMSKEPSVYFEVVAKEKTIEALKPKKFLPIHVTKKSNVKGHKFPKKDGQHFHKITKLTPEKVLKMIESKNPTQKSFQCDQDNNAQHKNLEKRSVSTIPLLEDQTSSIDKDKSNKVIKAILERQEKILRIPPPKFEDGHVKPHEKITSSKKTELCTTVTIVKELKATQNNTNKHDAILKMKESNSRQFGNCQTLGQKDGILKNPSRETDKITPDQQLQKTQMEKNQLRSQDKLDAVNKDEKLQEYKLSRNTIKFIKAETHLGGIKKGTLVEPCGNWFALNKGMPMIKKKESTLEDIKCISEEQLKHDADLIAINQKTFEEMEDSLHTVQHFTVDKSPNLNSSSIHTGTTGSHPRIEPIQAGKPNFNKDQFAEKSDNMKTSTKNTKDPIKKEMSTQALTRKYNFNKNIVKKPAILLQSKNEEAPTSTLSSKTFIKVKCFHLKEPNKSKKLSTCKQPVRKHKTFLKSASHQCILNRELLLQKLIVIKRSEHTLAKPASDTIIHEKLSHMRRTTKAVIKRQQVLTVLPKKSKIDINRKAKHCSIIELCERRQIKAKNTSKPVESSSVTSETI